MSNKAIFLDRDNTIIEDPGYINNPNQVKLITGAAEAIKEFRAMGYKLVVVSNQSAVARGIVSEKVLDEIHERLKQLLREKNVFLDGIYYCPYHPDGAIEKYRKKSEQRKPNPGMLLSAADEMDIELEQSWMIGDSGRDVEAGHKAGCKTILLDHPSYYKPSEQSTIKPNYKAVNLKEAVNIIKKHIRSVAGAVKETQPTFIPPSQQKQQVDAQEQDVTATTGPEQNSPGSTTEELLGDILRQLKRQGRNDMLGDFSIMRLMAGVIQIIVLFCLLISIWLLMAPEKQNDSILISLGFAMVLQIMALTFYVMQGRK